MGILDFTISCPHCILQQLPDSRRLGIFRVRFRRTGSLPIGALQTASRCERTVPYRSPGLRIGLPVALRWIRCMAGWEQTRRDRLFCCTNRAKGALARYARTHLRRLGYQEGHVLHSGHAAHRRNKPAAAAQNQGRSASTHGGNHQSH